MAPKVERLVLSLDIGATQSSVAILRTGGTKEEFFVVPRWPGQSVTDSKVPSTIYYRNGRAALFGQRAEDDGDPDDGFVLRNFKLILHPPEMRHLTERGTDGKPSHFEVPALPPNVTLETVYTDYIKFMLDGARRYYVGASDFIGCGDKVAWSRLIDSARYVLCVPNGWHEPQKDVVRRAFRRACPQFGHVYLPSEAEVSLHYVLNAPVKMLDLKDGKRIGVCDAGGSTVDLTMYKVVNASMRTFEETSVHCLQKGGIYVSRRVRQHVTDLLERRRYHASAEGHAATIDEVMRKFDTDTKLNFSSDLERGTQAIKLRFSAEPISDASCSIKRGWLQLKADHVHDAFDSCAKPIVDHIARQVFSSSGTPLVEDIVLVGGFGESPFLQERLCAGIPRVNLRISPQPEHKAVAPGGLYWWLNRDAVVKRGARYTYGIKLKKRYNKSVHGDHPTFVDASGSRMVRGVFEALIKMNDIVEPDHYHSFTFYRDYDDLDALDFAVFSVKLYCYPDRHAPYWLFDADGSMVPGYHKVVTLRCNTAPAQLAKLRNRAERLERKTDATRYEGTRACALPKRFYYSLSFKIMVAFGGIDLQAYLDLGDGVKGEVEIIPASI